jgi:hypothetical protein
VKNCISCSPHIASIFVESREHRLDQLMSLTVIEGCGVLYSKASHIPTLLLRFFSERSATLSNVDLKAPCECDHEILMDACQWLAQNWGPQPEKANVVDSLSKDVWLDEPP